MTYTPFDFSTFIDASKKAFAPAAKFNGLVAQNFERVARQNYVFAGELLDFSIQQMNLMSNAKDLNELASKQVELATQFSEKATQRSQDMVKLAADQQAEMTKWFDQTAADYAAVAKKAA